MSDLDFLDDLDDAGGYIASPTIRRRHTFAPPVPLEAVSGLTPTERKARDRARQRTTTARKLTEAWKEDGACKGSHLNFFPDPHENTDRQKQLCNACPVREPCLEYALARQEHGIWGGTGERERARIRRQRPRAS